MAALTKFIVMIATEGIPNLSPVTASCKLHDAVTASIADTGDQGVPLSSFLKYEVICGSAVIGLGSAHDSGHIEHLDEKPLQGVKNRLSALLPIRDNADRGPSRDCKCETGTKSGGPPS